MESWWERGFVPDSDDEDAFDSQEGINPVDDQTGPQDVVEDTTRFEDKAQVIDDNGAGVGEDGLGPLNGSGTDTQGAVSSQYGREKGHVQDKDASVGDTTLVQSGVGSELEPAKEASQGQIQREACDNRSQAAASPGAGSRLEATREAGQEPTQEQAHDNRGQTAPPLAEASTKKNQKPASRSNAKAPDSSLMPNTSPPVQQSQPQDTRDIPIPPGNTSGLIPTQEKDQDQTDGLTLNSHNQTATPSGRKVASALQQPSTRRNQPSPLPKAKAQKSLAMLNASLPAQSSQPQDIWDVPSSPDELQLDNWHTQRPDPPNAQAHSRTRSVSDASSLSPLSSPRSSLQSVPLNVGDQGQGDQEHPPDLEDQPRSPSIHPSRLDDGQGQVGQEQRTELRDDLRDDLEDILPSLDIPDDILQELAQPTRRSLRQRNPIQLHPYLLEDAKYQGLMKTRGVKPVRIAQAQEAVRAAVSRSRGQDHAASQLPPTNPAPGRQLPPSSSPQSRLAASSPPVSREFPRRRFQQNTPARENPRDPQPLNQPSSRPHRTYKRRKISHADGTRDQQDLHRERENMPRNPSRPSVFDIPPSPPRSGSVSSAHSANFSEGFRFPRGLTPPLTTPVTEPKLRSTDTDDARARALPGSIAEEPHDDAVSASSQSQPNSDEEDGLNEAEVRKMRRRMKGVLPASWLRLDLKKQEERMRATKGNRDSPHRSDAKGVAKRGRKWNAATPSGPRQEPMSIMDLADTDEDDDGSDKDSVTGDAGRALANLVGFEEEFHEQDFDDDIPEDNQIDYMLPPVPRGPRNGQRTQGVKRRRSERDSARTGGNWKRARLKRQTRITDPVYGARKAKQSPRASRRPALLDAPDVTQRPRKEQPPFLRVAARQARLRREGGRPPRTSKPPTTGSRQGMGTHAPSRQKQRPRQQSSLTQSRPQTGRRQPLAERSANERLTLNDGNEDTSENAAAPVTAVPPGENHGTSVSAPYPDAPDPAPESRDYTPSSKRPGVPERLGNKWVIRRNLAVSSLTRNAPRPAAPEVENTSSNSASPSLFHRSLSKLNRDYRHERATQARKPNMPFDRFLDGNSSLTGLSGNQQTRNQPPIPCAEPKRLERDRQKTQPQPRPRQQRKRTPRRLVLDTDDRQETPGAFFQTPAPSPAEDIEILGPPRQKPGSLFGFQPSYTIDFDITPVCSGTFFHESTFLGSGEFSRLRNILQRSLDEDVGSLSIVVGSRNCHWGAWNETVSSELSTTFDLLVKEVETSGSVSTDADLETVTSQGCTLYRAMIKYVTETLSFTDPVDRAGFVIRAHSLVSKLSEHLSAVAPGSARGRVHFVKLCSYNLAFASQIRHIASHNLVEHSLTNDALNLVHSVAGQLFAFVSSHAGLTEIRKFLKDTKFSAYSDSGVRDSPPVEAFVIARHLLRGSDKYDGWLERITTEVCLSSMRGEPGSLKDVRSLETEWRNLFTMLPLNEVDQFGVARIGSRFRESFDNWNLVRRLLSPILDDYETSSSAQPISYINYCRVVFRRCFHLINDWGWRNCKPVLDTLYDFFAKRTLYNLKHEQSFGSPNFLEDLDRNPSLMVTPRDSCFHILLKIIGSGLRFMSKTHEKKQIRNSAWRLLPNHGRVYPKEMPLREEDLDALRNHHDLLCTLYWAVPDGCRPRLEAIRNLVDPASSHRETIKISLRSWLRLIRFKLSTDEDVSGLGPFSDWHSYFVTELLKQHSHARTEVEAQSNGESRFSHMVERTISQNQQQIELLLSTALGGLQSAVRLSPTLEHAWRLVSKMPLKAILGLFNAKLTRVNSIVSEALRVVVTYTAKCDAPVPFPAPAVAASSDDDSQEYGDWRAIFDHEATEPSPGIEYVQKVLHPTVSRLVSNCFGEDHSPDDTILLGVVDCWTSVARTFTRNQLRYWDSYLSPYDGDSWTALRSTVQMRKFTPQFLASCIEKDSRFFPECKAQVLGMWMSTLVERASMLKFQHRLTEALLNQDPTNPLLKNLPFFKNHRDDRYSITLEEFSQRRLSLISSVLSNMREHVQEMEDVDGWEDKMVKQEYHELLQKLMGSMKSNYQELGSGIQSTQGAYVDFVHRIVGFLQQHTRDISAINPFFTDPKSFPLPSADPRYIVAKLKSYEPKLSSERAVKALAVFIQGVSERAATDGEQAYLVNQLHESMANTYEGGCPNRPTLRTVLLQCAFPAYLEVAFKHPAAWILSRPILQTISVTFKELLFNMDTTDPNCLSSVTNIFNSIFQATYQAFHFLTEDPDLLTQSTVLTTATTFMEMITSSLPVIEYIDRVTETGEYPVLQIQAFRQFALFALSRIRDESLPYSLEEFTRLSAAFATEHVHVHAHVPPTSSAPAPTTDFREDLRHSASRELLSYINKNYSEHQGKYYFTRRGGATSQLKEVKIEPAVRAMLENAPGMAFKNAVHTFLNYLQRLDLFGEAD